MQISPNITILVSSFNKKITENLLDGARWKLYNEGLSKDQVKVVHVPGAFELPLAAKWAISESGCGGVLALGCVIRGETPHFDYVCRESSRGLMEVGLASSIPVIFGVLTVDHEVQASTRSKTVSELERLKSVSCPPNQIKDMVDNKGVEAAEALIRMLEVRSEFSA